MATHVSDAENTQMKGPFSSDSDDGRTREFLHWIADPVRWIYRTVLEWRHRRELYIRLISLDDHLLQDIGLTRGDIWAAAKGDFRRTPANANTSSKNVA